MLPADESPRRVGEELISALRGANAVTTCDALLAAGPVDWAAVADAHRKEPFRRAQSRALIARRDCPDDLTAALLMPWHPKVANHLAARQDKWSPTARSAVRKYELPEAVRCALLPRTSQLRRPLLRILLTEHNARDVVRSTTRLDLLVRAADGYDHNHMRQLCALWDAVGAELRAALGEDRPAWMTAAERLPEYPGSLQELLDGLHKPMPRSERRTADLRVLAQAPTKLLTVLIAGLDDEELAATAAPCDRRLAEVKGDLSRIAG
ncbi:hypothetical protein [Streptomyces sp. NPDC006510]|uniref:hypothetical protein n=1 Tax=Streptomyces sp. NPDC006510 TaxID=3155600 RepID=UPI0033B0ABCA